MELPSLSIQDMKLMIAERDIAIEQFKRLAMDLETLLTKTQLESADLARKAEEYMKAVAAEQKIVSDLRAELAGLAQHLPIT